MNKRKRKKLRKSQPKTSDPGFIPTGLVTSGGRVLGFTAVGNTLDEARRKGYEGVATIRFDGMYYRKDIGVEND